MLNFFDAMAVFGASLATGAALYSVLRVNRQLRAEAELVRRLIQRERYLLWLRRHEALLLSERRVSSEDIAELRDYIERELKTLRAEQRRPIEEALNQPSARGRASYVGKLVEQSARELELQH